MPDDSCATTGTGSGLEDRDEGVSMATASVLTDPVPFGMPLEPAPDGAGAGEDRLIEALTSRGLTPPRCSIAVRSAMASSCPCNEKGQAWPKTTARRHGG